MSPPEDVRGRVLLELDGRDEPQHNVPVLADQGVVARPVGLDAPAFVRPALRLEDLEGLAADALDARCEGEAQQVRDAEHGLGIPVTNGGMDVAPDHVIVHQSVDQVGAFTVGAALIISECHWRMAVVDEGVGADALSLAEILERSGWHTGSRRAPRTSGRP